jgi:hypothetical protein
MDERIPEPTPAGHPLWDGIYDFPWQIRNLKVLIPLWLAFSFFALLLAGYHVLFSFIAEQAGKGDATQTGMFGIAVRAGGHIFAGLTVLSILSLLYPAACFLATVEDTAGGNDEVKWESISPVECVGKLLYLTWVFGCGAALAAIIIEGISLAVPMPRELWWGLVYSLALFLFPINLLSTLAAASPLVLLEPRLLTAYVSRWYVAALLYANTVFVAITCLLYGLWTFMDYNLWLAPLTGFVWVTAFLVYARILGRAGWVLSGGEDQIRMRKSRQREILERG